MDNLMSNAVKYLPRGAQITVLQKAKRVKRADLVWLAGSAQVEAHGRYIWVEIATGQREALPNSPRY
jgi:signal transduction histidine kinase